MIFHEYMIFYEYTVNNPITGISSVLFMPGSLSFNRQLIQYSDVVKVYKSDDLTRGRLSKCRGGYSHKTNEEHVSLLDFKTDLDVYSIIMEHDYPEKYTKSSRQLIPMIHYCGFSFAKIDLNTIPPELYATYISAFWSTQI